MQNIYPNTKLSDLPPGSEVLQAASAFSQYYSRLLKALHATFNDNPDDIEHTICMMYDVKLVGETLAAMPFPENEGSMVGPTFEFLPLT